MSKHKTQRVKGLSNLATLMVRAPETIAQPAPKREVNTQESIVRKTVEAVVGHVNKFDNDIGDFNAFERFIGAAVREAFNLGHASAVGQNNMVEDLLKQQYRARTELTMPAVVAAVMEQTGQDTMLLDLDMVATVFSRCRLEHDTLAEAGHPNTMEYSLIYLADDGKKALTEELLHGLRRQP